MKRSILIIAASALALAACNTQTGNNSSAALQPGTNIGIDLAWMDKAVVPGDDFYNYADGTWMRTTEIPADRSSIGGFFIAHQIREKNTRELLGGTLYANPNSGNSAFIGHY